MSSFKCVCGKLLSNVDTPNDMELIVFTQREWEKITEEVHDGLTDIFDVDPKYEHWLCHTCNRIHVFYNSKVILRYIVEQDNR